MAYNVKRNGSENGKQKKKGYFTKKHVSGIQKKK
jgi:hypothetical protein